MEKNIKDSVKIISKTMPINDIEDMRTSEDIISYCARVSNPSNQENFDTASGLLTYCVNNKHWSPFEMVDLTLEITTTRDISRQIIRHRSFSFQEFSQRYADPTEALGFTTRPARLQDKKNRQNSIETDDISLQKNWHFLLEEFISSANHLYKWAKDNNIAKEIARIVLPEGCTLTRMYMKGSVRSWIHYCEVRKDPTTQKEHRDIADKCWNIILKEYPFLKDMKIENENKDS